MSFNRTAYDECAYSSAVVESMAPGAYVFATPVRAEAGLFSQDDRVRKGRVVANAFGADWADVASDLRGITTPPAQIRRCGPGPAFVARDVPVTDTLDLRSEDTLISNPPATLRERGVNRFECLLDDPQDRVLRAPLERIGVNNRTLVKDAHVPCLPNV